MHTGTETYAKKHSCTQKHTQRSTLTHSSPPPPNTHTYTYGDTHARTQTQTLARPHVHTGPEVIFMTLKLLLSKRKLVLGRSLCYIICLCSSACNKPLCRGLLCMLVALALFMAHYCSPYIAQADAVSSPFFALALFYSRCLSPFYATL